MILTAHSQGPECTLGLWWPWTTSPAISNPIPLPTGPGTPCLSYVMVVLISGPVSLVNLEPVLEISMAVCPLFLTRHSGLTSQTQLVTSPSLMTSGWLTVTLSISTAVLLSLRGTVPWSVRALPVLGTAWAPGLSPLLTQPLPVDPQCLLVLLFPLHTSATASPPAFFFC